MIEHRIYGLDVLAESALFETAIPVSGAARSDQRALELRPGTDISVGHTPATIPLYFVHDRELFLHTDRELAFSQRAQPWCIEVKDVVSFRWHGQDSVVYYQCYEQGSRSLLVFWFVHIFLPLYLTLERGYDFIHAAAVEVDEGPILFIAESTGGKSTLGDYFLKQGHAMLSDDKVATFLQEGEFYAVPSHPHHRPWREFEVLGDPVENFATGAKPIHAFYILERGEPGSQVEISEVTGFRKFEELMPNYLYSFRFLQEQRLRWLAQLADQSLVFRVKRPWNMDRMHDVYDAICVHSREIGSSAG